MVSASAESTGRLSAIVVIKGWFDRPSSVPECAAFQPRERAPQSSCLPPLLGHLPSRPIPVLNLPWRQDAVHGYQPSQPRRCEAVGGPLPPLSPSARSESSEAAICPQPRARSSLNAIALAGGLAFDPALASARRRDARAQQGGSGQWFSESPSPASSCSTSVSKVTAVRTRDW